MAQNLSNFTIAAEPRTDIWKKPPHTDVFTAPHNLDELKPLPLSRFDSARITFSGQWTHKYDQAGLLLVIEDGVTKSWIKAGLEHFNDTPQISFVGCDRFADWSVHPLHASSSEKVTVELRREGDENGVALWAYELVLDEKGNEKARYPVRECTWLWHEEHKKQVRVGACCARPSPADDNLTVHFEQLNVKARSL